MIKPLTLDAPYPKIDYKVKDNYSVALLSPFYCGANSELGSFLSYTYSEFIFTVGEDEKAIELFKSIAYAEILHLKLIGQALLKLGVDPIFTKCPLNKSDYYTTQNISTCCSIKKTFVNAITAKMTNIKEYEKCLKMLKSNQVTMLVERILQDERLHLQALKEHFVSSNVKFF